MQPHTMLRALLTALLATSAVACGKVKPPTFSPGSYTPKPATYASATVASASQMLEGMKIALSMYSVEHKSLLYGGDAKLSLSDDRKLVLNLRHPGDMYRTPCSFWFRAEIGPSTWQVATTPRFSVRLDPGQFVVEENCTSRFGNDIPLILTFETPGEGERFMDLMAAMANAPDATAPERTGSTATETAGDTAISDTPSPPDAATTPST